MEDPIRSELCPEDIESVENLDGNYKDGDLKGCCAVTLRNGLHVSGNFRKRRRIGPGLVAGPWLESNRGVHSVWGSYKGPDGVLTGPGKARIMPKGNSKDIYSEGIVLEGDFLDGRYTVSRTFLDFFELKDYSPTMAQLDLHIDQIYLLISDEQYSDDVVIL